MTGQFQCVAQGTGRSLKKEVRTRRLPAASSIFYTREE